MNADGSAGAITIFADGAALNAANGTTGALDGADGIQFDVAGNLYVCANQANEIQVLSPTGALAARYRGTGSDAMDFPASPTFHEKGLYIANLALTHFGQGKISVLGVPLAGAPVRTRASGVPSAGRGRWSRPPASPAAPDACARTRRLPGSPRPSPPVRWDARAAAEARKRSRA